MNQRILIIGPLPPPIGGQSVLVQEIYKGLVDSNINVEVFDISHQISGFFYRLFFSLSLQVRLLIKLLMFRPSLVHVHSSSGMPLFEKLVFCLYSKFFRSYVVLHLHGGKMRDHWSRYNFFMRRIFKYLFSILTDGLIVLSEGWRIFYIDELGYKKPIIVLPNAVSVPKHLSKCLGQKVSIVFLGKVCAAKGVMDLATSLRLMTGEMDFILNVIGPFEKEEELDIRDAFDKCSVKVDFHGALMGEAKWDLLSSASFFILPSHSEDLPISIIEAMGVGLPIVATEVGSVSDLVDSSNGILIEPKNPAALAKAISDLVSDEGMRDAMSKSSLKKAIKYNFDEYIGHLIKTYRGIAR